MTASSPARHAHPDSEKENLSFSSNKRPKISAEQQKSNEVIVLNSSNASSPIVHITSSPPPAIVASSNNNNNNNNNANSQNKKHDSSSPAQSKKSTSSPTKPELPSSSLIEFKANKLVLKQKKLPLDRQPSTLREQLSFQTYLDSLDPSTVPETFPEEHLPLIAKYAHESEKGLVELAKQTSTLLRPSDGDAENQDEDNSDSPPRKNPLTLAVIQGAINQVARRVNYGVSPSDFATRGYEPENINVPNSLCIWRWEAIDTKHLPKEVVEKCRKRIQERTQAREDALKIFLAFDKSILDYLLSKQKSNNSSGVKNLSNLVTKKKKEKDSSAVNKSEKTNTTTTPKKHQNNNNTKETQTTPSNSNDSASTTTPESKLASKKQLSKKNDQTTEKQRGMFASFFKSKPSQPEPKTTKSQNESDFNKQFKPYHLKTNVTLAPINVFVKRRQKFGMPINSTTDSIINTRPDLTRQEVLDNLKKSSFGFPAVSTSIKPKIGAKDVMQKISQQALLGVDNHDKHWSDLRKIPIKLLKFAEDCRPGYVGTWSKQSDTIKPRRPLGKDTVLNYEYDSEAEWEEEEEGGEDVNDDDRSDEDDEIEDDDDDGFFCDDDEIEMMEGYENFVDTPDGAGMEMDAATMKRFQANNNKRRRVIGPLVPIQLGPHHEQSFGNTLKTLDPYKIQFLNGSKPGLNPFTYVTKPWLPTTNPSTSASTSSSSTIPSNVTAKIPRRKKIKDQSTSTKPKSKQKQKQQQDNNDKQNNNSESSTNSKSNETVNNNDNNNNSNNKMKSSPIVDVKVS